MARKKKRGAKIYAIFLSVYILLLAAAAMYGLSKVWEYAVEYENSRPDNVMNEYVVDLSENLWDESIAQTIAAMPHEMQSDDDCAEIVQEMLRNDITYSRVGGGDELTQIYNLRCNGSVFGKVTLKQDESKADEVKYGMLPWLVYKEEFDFTGLYTSIEVTIPASYSVQLNGNTLGHEYIIADGIHMDVLDAYYSSYSNLPTKVTYRFDNIIGKLDPVILDEDGNEFVIDPEKDDSQFIKGVDEERLARFQDFSERFIERYEKYISGIYSSETQYGYQRLLPYIKTETDFDSRMKMMQDGLSWAHNSYLSVNYVTVNSAISLGEDTYIVDISFGFNVGTPRGEETYDENAKLIVTDIGGDTRVITMDMY